MKEERKHIFSVTEKKEIIGILIESAFYFELTLKERAVLIKNILAS